jgi:hypothetical protein
MNLAHFHEKNRRDTAILTFAGLSFNFPPQLPRYPLSLPLGAASKRISFE